ncbi:MAG: helix-turn-helix domain-containing protein [Roseobacter sp.]
MTDDPANALAQLPQRLRKARSAQGLSLDAVAKLSGVSRSMVSQIERGESSPTISTLWNLTQALQVDFAGLLESGARAQEIEVLRADAAPTIDNLGSGCRIRILSPPEDAGKHELYELTLEQGGKLDSQPHARGTRELLTVISGQIKATSGNASSVLGAGDTARYAADSAHCLEALGAPAKAILIVQST